MNRIREKKFYWIGGSVIAFSGVALVKILSPALNGPWHKMAMVTGYVLVIAGIMLLSYAPRRQEGGSPD